jgi:serine/threonine-protein kinase RsbW
VSPAEQEVRLELRCEPASVGVARDAVAALAEGLGVAVDDVRIAVSEAVGNVVQHAYRGGSAGGIRVFARNEGGHLVVTVSDDGIGMTPNLASRGLRLGIPLITKLCDDVRFTSSERGTVVEMSFFASAPVDA